MDEFHDSLITEQAVRDVQAKLDSGEITHEELADAKAYLLTANCDCGQTPNENGRCPKCLVKFSSEEPAPK